MTMPALRPSRHGYLLLAGGLVAVFLALFALAEWLHVPVLTDARPLPDDASWLVAVAGVGLLTVDVVLPVPASALMIAHGAVFGFWPGMLLSLTGGTLATVLAYFVGRGSRPVVDRLLSADQQRRGAELVARHGTWAVVASRPVPVFAETVAILSGTTSALRWWQVAVAGAAGNLVPAVAYAAVGSTATSSANGLVVVLAVLALAAFVWVVQSLIRSRRISHHARTPTRDTASPRT